jgi:hypothetical protein
VAQANSTNQFSVTVTDSGAPPLSATQNFNVVISPLNAASLTNLSLAGGQVTLQAGGDTGPDYTIQASTNLAVWTNLFTTNFPVPPFNWTDTNAGRFAKRFYRLSLGP